MVNAPDVVNICIHVIRAALSSRESVNTSGFSSILRAIPCRLCIGGIRNLRFLRILTVLQNVLGVTEDCSMSCSQLAFLKSASSCRTHLDKRLYSAFRTRSRVRCHRFPTRFFSLISSLIPCEIAQCPACHRRVNELLPPVCYVMSIKKVLSVK